MILQSTAKGWCVVPRPKSQIISALFFTTYDFAVLKMGQTPKGHPPRKNVGNSKRKRLACEFLKAAEGRSKRPKPRAWLFLGQRTAGGVIGARRGNGVLRHPQALTLHVRSCARSDGPVPS